MADTYRILVTGSREWYDAAKLAFHLGEAVGEARKAGRTPVIVHGACPTGADIMAAHIAHDHSIQAEDHPADWRTHGKPAGFRRNAEMVALGADLCLAFIRRKSPGATHCASLAEKAGIPVRRFTDG